MTVEQRFHSVIQRALPLAHAVEAELPTLPAFSIEPGRKPGQFRIVEDPRPNWWQLRLAASFWDEPDVVELEQLLSRTEPFSQTIGKTIVTPGLSELYQARDIVRQIIINYLFAVRPPRWRIEAFLRVWVGFKKYFDPRNQTVCYTLFAPVYGLRGLRRSVSLDEQVSLKKVSPRQLAQIATKCRDVRPQHVLPGIPIWTSAFLIGAMELPKRVVAQVLPQGEDRAVASNGALPEPNPAREWYSRINEEVVLMRALLSKQIAVPIYAIQRDGYPLDSGGGAMPPELPWRTHRDHAFSDQTSSAAIRQYARRRRILLSMSTLTGWSDVLASMRRFAIAWENPFHADRLADVVAALEKLLVSGERDEVSYKLRVRAAHLLRRSPADRAIVMKAIRDAYGYRSIVAHGSFVADQHYDVATAERLTPRSKRSRRHSLETVAEVQRLLRVTSDLFHEALDRLITRRTLAVDWAAFGL